MLRTILTGHKLPKVQPFWRSSICSHSALMLSTGVLPGVSTFSRGGGCNRPTHSSFLCPSHFIPYSQSVPFFPIRPLSPLRAFHRVCCTRTSHRLRRLSIYLTDPLSLSPPAALPSIGTALLVASSTRVFVLSKVSQQQCSRLYAIPSVA